ncbi:hypothetical protein C0991_012056 [Blastosporella zonata]|nr:hypothetical protein C0991_012056 [Blastosporella zonata]
MLSLLRNATRPSAAAVARPLSLARYSTDVEPGVEGLRETQAILTEVADNQPTPTGRARSFAGGAAVVRGVQVQKWKPFRPNSFVKPHDFTYKSRFNSPSTYMKRRPHIGPPPSISRYYDVFHQFDLDPVDLAMNRDVLSQFVSEMGKTYGRNITGLTTTSQRRMGKAIRRAKMMGIIPVLSKSRDLLYSYGRSSP